MQTKLQGDDGFSLMVLRNPARYRDQNSNLRNLLCGPKRIAGVAANLILTEPNERSNRYRCAKHDHRCGKKASQWDKCYCKNNN